ncbi:uncharacterized protein Tco025E_02581 [Trypanosoma conorhini]|uniref:Uncharacterized protein n=1 Tax=Trypanosoma conorhini TaxID=83891 RepID=A0A422Q2Y3_9TRYP|nr:uncharacterized protein Tco025E_02581 [Trypanosoma conorhini]RNF24292.1 hypothetical protein Tco025E_02581 [Trypanosoma conorhini]
MRRWSPWRRVTAAAALTHRWQLLTGGVPESRGRAVGLHDAAKYQIPLRRALHLVEKGRRMSAVAAEGAKNGDEAVCSDGAEALLHEDAARYAAYHCHHMLTSFRVERRRWTESNALSFDDLSRVMEYVFFAALLLHLTALFETADKYCEALIDVAVSCTIFLSKGADRLNRTDVLLRGRAGAKAGSAPNRASAEARVDPWNSLHWAVLHFTSGICGWGLLDHTEPLFDMQRTMKPYAAMLRTFARVTRECLAGAHLSAADLTFLSCLATTEGAAKWLGAAADPASSPANTATSAEKHPVEEALQFSQQRRLQLLPLVWMALLSRHSALVGTPHSFHPARHALLHVLPLFQKEAEADAALRLSMQCSFFPSSSLKASSVEMGVVLAQLERHGVFSSPGCMNGEILHAWMCTQAPEESAPTVKTARGAYMAFRSIPLCALQVVGAAYTATSDGEAFVHELLFRALTQWPFYLSERTMPEWEIEQLVLSAQHVTSLFEAIKQRERDQRRAGAAVVVVEATLRAFAVRVAVICTNGTSVKGTTLPKLAEFDRLLNRVLRGGVGGHMGGCVPEVYDKNRHLWLCGTQRGGSCGTA